MCFIVMVELNSDVSPHDCSHTIGHKNVIFSGECATNACTHFSQRNIHTAVQRSDRVIQVVSVQGCYIFPVVTPASSSPLKLKHANSHGNLNKSLSVERFCVSWETFFNFFYFPVFYSSSFSA